MENSTEQVNTELIIETLGQGAVNNLVQKSYSICNLFNENFNLGEYKLLDVYLSRIDSKHPEYRTVRFRKGELEKIFEVERIRTEDLDKRLTNLMQPVTLYDKETGGFEKINLFEVATCKPDEFGIWNVLLSCTETAMKYIFNIHEIGYIKYRLKAIIRIKTLYTYKVFMYLEKNRVRHSWTVAIDEFRNEIGCADIDTYKKFKYLNSNILQPAHKEINENTPCRYTYEPIKQGKTVSAIKFTLEELPGEIGTSVNTQEEIVQLETRKEEKHYSRLWESLFEDEETKKSTLSDANRDYIAELLSEIPRYKMFSSGIISQDDTSLSAMEIREYDYVDFLLKKINRQNEENVSKGKKPIKDLTKYLIKVLEKERSQELC